MSQNSKKSIAQQYDGPWMKPEVLGALPQLKRDYQRNADPEREAMRRYAQLSEAERRQSSVIHEAKRRRAAEQNVSRNRSGDDGREETERGEAGQADGRASKMVKNSQPKAELRPPEQIARQSNQAAFGHSWLKEQRDAAMAQAKANQVNQETERQQERSSGPSLSEPSR